MSDLNRRSKRSILVLSVIAIAGLAITEREGSYLLLAAGAAVIAWYLVEKEHRLRVPRMLISVGIVAALGYACVEIFISKVPPVPALARCFVYCQIVKYFQTKTMREYGELIVLSMMVMVTAAALSADVLFAALLIAYLYAGAHCLFLFGLRRTAERMAQRQVRAGLVGGVSEVWSSGQVTGGPLRLRGLVSLSGLVLLAAAAVVFATMPRLGPARSGGIWQARQPVALTGFSDQVSLGDIGKLLRNNARVMRVTFRRNGRPVRMKKPILMRGSTLLLYRRGNWRALPHYGGGMMRIDLRGGRYVSLLNTDGPADGGLEQDIWLEPIASDCLFAAYVPFAIRSDIIPAVKFHHRFDLGLRLMEPAAGSAHYSVRSVDPSDPSVAPLMRWDKDFAELFAEAVQRESEIPEAVGALAKRWVADIDAEGKDRWALARLQAELIERRLLSDEFSYSLDVGEPDPTVDPIEDFLLRRKTGYCEHFASAMVLMCQSLRIPARLVNGFKQGRYNEVGDYHGFQQNDAHSWVEVLFPDQGWIPFDPTPPAAQPPPSWAGTLKGYADFLQYSWTSQVIYFGIGDYNMMMAQIETMWSRTQLNAAAISRHWFEAVAGLFGDDRRGAGESGTLRAVALAVGFVVALAAGGLATALMIVRRRRRRKGVAGGPDAPVVVPFYERITELLAGRGFVRQPPQTPREFAEGVLRRAGGAVPDTLGEAVRCFYQVRFGRRELSARQRQIIDALIEELRRDGAGDRAALP